MIHQRDEQEDGSDPDHRRGERLVADSESDLSGSPGGVPAPQRARRSPARVAAAADPRLNLRGRTAGTAGRRRGRAGALRVVGARRFSGDPVALLDTSLSPLCVCSASKRRISRAARDSVTAMLPARK